MSDAKIESDPLFTLLTDALCAGPGSPQWSRAVAEVRQRGDGADEYQMLIEARKNLESGRDYRSVQAGPGFARKLMRGLDDDADVKTGGVPTTNLIAGVSAVVIVAVIGLLAYLVVPADKPSPGVDQLTSTYFSSPLQTLRFDEPLGSDWKQIGSMPLDLTKGLRSGPTTAKPPVGGGIYWTTPLPAEQPVAFEATLRINRPTEDVTVQLFVTDKPDFSADRGSSSHELVWQHKGSTAQVFLPNGLSQGLVERQKDSRDKTVRIVFNRDVALIDMNGKRLWAGGHDLATDQPRYVGIRLIRTAGDKADAVVVTGLRLLKP